MMANCSYAKSVWQQVELWSGEQQLKQHLPISKLIEWWTKLNPGDRRSGNPQNLRATIIVYTAWNLWKERCRRVFDNKAQNEQNLVAVIKADVLEHQRA
jgi:hypothetical protein